MSELETHRTCKQCGETKPINRFKKGTSPKGVTYRTRACSLCISRGNRGLELRRLYGIDEAQYDALLAAQGGCCAVPGCGAVVATSTGKRLYVDHDRRCCPSRVTCGQCVRGLLCDRHNRAVGLLHDDAGEARAVASYLSRRRRQA